MSTGFSPQNTPKSPGYSGSYRGSMSPYSPSMESTILVSKEDDEDEPKMMIFPKYGNALPEIPLDPKSLRIPPIQSNMYEFNYNSLQRHYDFDLHCDVDMGLNVDLVTHDANKAEDFGDFKLDPKDEALLEDEEFVAQLDENKLLDPERSKIHAKPVSWMRKTTYISSEQTPFQPMYLENLETQIGYKLQKKIRQQPMYGLDTDEQIQAIEQSFDAVDESIKMHTRPSRFPVEILSVLPKKLHQKAPRANPLMHVCFGTDPAHCVSREASGKQGYALLRRLEDENGKEFSAIYEPSPQTYMQLLADKEQRNVYDPTKEYTFVLSREYDLILRDIYYEDSVILTRSDDFIYYTPINQRALMCRRFKYDYKIIRKKLVSETIIIMIKISNIGQEVDEALKAIS